MKGITTKAHHHNLLIMGCHFVLTAIHNDPQIAWDALRAGEDEIKRIERLISSWSEESETSLVNNNAGLRPVKVSAELFNLVERCIRVSDLTQGAFDITGTLARYYWNFNRQEQSWLEESKILELKGLCDYKLIHMDKDNHTIFLEKKGMKIGFGAIGKGYAAQCAKLAMQTKGIERGLVNASGDLICWGDALNTSHWKINIPNPEKRQESLLAFNLLEGSVVTSGNFENYFLRNNIRYSHIIDPRTGVPVVALKNVSIVCPNAELGDALATAVSVLGLKDGLGLVDTLNGVECMIIDKDNNLHFSNHIKKLIA